MSVPLFLPPDCRSSAQRQRRNRYGQEAQGQHPLGATPGHDLGILETDHRLLNNSEQTGPFECEPEVIHL